MTIPADARRQVIRRAEDRCEYCGLSRAGQEALFHVDHVVPVTAGGTAALDNLALACVSCSLRKGARQQAPDPKNRQRGAAVPTHAKKCGDVISGGMAFAFLASRRRAVPRSLH